MAHKKSFLITSGLSAIIIFLLLGQSLSLKCYTCNSSTEENCVNNLQDEFLKDCAVEETSPTSTVSESTTETTSSTTTKIPESTTTTKTPESTTTKTPESTTTTKTPVSTTTTKTPESTTTTKTSESTAASKTPESTTTTKTPKESNSDKDNKDLYSVKLISRFTRAISRENEDLICYTIVENGATIRGCAQENEKKCNDKKATECSTCTTDGCNSSADFRFLSPILPLLVAITFILNR